MRAVARIVIAVLLVSLTVSPGSAAVRKPPKPLVFHPHWRLIVRSKLEFAAVSGRYVAFVRGYGGGPVTLFDERTGTRKMLSPPNCLVQNYSWGGWTQPIFFDAPWLLVGCGYSSPARYDLYNLQSRQWAPLAISSQCQGNCHVVAIGRYWIKILTDEGTVMYGPSDYYLQNIATGQFERDPATPNGTTFDDLGSPSGSRPLCPPLHYPYVYGSHSPTTLYLGSLNFYGPFALIFEEAYYGDPLTYRLRRCGTNLNIVFPDYYGVNPPVASPRAVIQTTDRTTLYGWFLPSLRTFTIPNVYVEPLAVTDDTIYIDSGDQGKLWAATLPSPSHPQR